MSKRKKNKSKPIFLSPKKIIKDNARRLPIHECFVNQNWQESDMAIVVVARRHKGGTITSGLYLVDLLCMGIKDTYFRFNDTLIDYEEFIEKLSTGDPLTQIDYTLAHNIIYSGYEFALDCGLKPHPDFLTVTQYILEEDNDDIELIDIECGHNGKPLILRGPHNYNEATETYHAVCKAIGEENVILEEIDEEGLTDQDEETSPYDYEEYLYDNPVKEKHNDINLFLEISKYIRESDSPEKNKRYMADLHVVAKRLFYNNFTTQEIEKSRDRMWEFFNVELTTSPGKILGIDETHPDYNKIIKEILELGSRDKEALIKDSKILHKLTSKYPSVPHFRYLDIREKLPDPDSDKNIPDEYFAELKKLREMFPDYTLLKLFMDLILIFSNKPPELINDKLIKSGNIIDIFPPGTKELTNDELYLAIEVVFHYLFKNDEFLLLDSLSNEIYYSYMEYFDIRFEEIYALGELGKVLYCQKKYLDY